MIGGFSARDFLSASSKSFSCWLMDFRASGAGADGITGGVIGASGGIIGVVGGGWTGTIGGVGKVVTGAVGIAGGMTGEEVCTGETTTPNPPVDRLDLLSVAVVWFFISSAISFYKLGREISK